VALKFHGPILYYLTLATSSSQHCFDVVFHVALPMSPYASNGVHNLHMGKRLKKVNGIANIINV
jgi:hypothetical protein